MKPFIFEQWHAWQADNPFTKTNGILLSDEDNKSLKIFDNVDDTVNWLFLNGYKTAARALNNHVKADK